MAKIITSITGDSALTFDDVLLQPARSDVLPTDVVYPPLDKTPVKPILWDPEWPRFGLGGTNMQIAQFDPDNAVVTVSSVPEPGAWAMLLAGFLGLGTALRRARRPGLAV